MRGKTSPPIEHGIVIPDWLTLISKMEHGFPIIGVRLSRHKKAHKLWQPIASPRETYLMNRLFDLGFVRFEWEPPVGEITADTKKMAYLTDEGKELAKHAWAIENYLFLALHRGQ